MGASKEGMMSLRERINLVLHESLEEGGLEGDDGVSRPSNNGAILFTSLATKTKLGSTAKVTDESDKRESPGASGRLEGLSLSQEAFASGNGLSLHVMQRLLVEQLYLISDISERLSNAEFNEDRMRKECEQLQGSLSTEQLQRRSTEAENMKLRERNRKQEAIIKEQNEKIRELDLRMEGIANASKGAGSAVSKGTNMAHASLKSSHRSTPTREVDNETEGPFGRRRMKRLNCDESDVAGSISKRLKTFSSGNSSLPSLTQSQGSLSIVSQKNSDSPPQLSPAVTPNSTATNQRARGIRSFQLGDFADSDDIEFPPDEFQDELRNINYLSQDSSSNDSRSHQIASSRKHPLVLSGSSAFSRPSPGPHDRNDRAVIPDNKRRFMFTGSMKPGQQQLTSNNDASKSNVSLSREPPQLISNRPTYFLNRNDLNKPLARRPPAVTYPSASSYSAASFERAMAEDCAQKTNFRSLDASNQLVEATRVNENSVVNAEPVIPVKRRPGRQPGFRPKKRLPNNNSNTSGTNDLRLVNGGLTEEFKSKAEPEPPQRFSKRGRLLKPNRARYSPEPDLPTHSTREKFMSTKKSYYVSEPFVPEGFGGSMDGSFGAEGPLGGVDGFSFSRQLLDEDEERLCSSSLTIPVKDGVSGEDDVCVEVPQWRITNLQGFQDGEERVLPDDDMSDEAFHKRHQKPESQEKQRKRWDLQMLREESYKERMQRKQAEREKQKELRRQQRKRKGRGEATEEEAVNPNIDDIKAVYVGDVIPIGAWGQSLPISEKVNFHFSTGCVTFAAPPTPRPKSQIVAAALFQENTDTNTNAISSSNLRETEVVSSISEGNSRDLEMSGLSLAKYIESQPPVAARSFSRYRPTPPPPQIPLCSSPSSSSVSLSSAPSPAPLSSSTPPPPVIFCMRDSHPTDVYEYTEEDEETNVIPNLLRNEAGVTSRRIRDCLPSSSSQISNEDDISTDCSSSQETIAIYSKVPSIPPDPFTVPLAPGKSVNGNRLESLDVLTTISTSSIALSQPTYEDVSKATSINFFIPKNPLVSNRPRVSSSSTSGVSSSVALVGSNDDQLCSDKSRSLRS